MNQFDKAIPKRSDCFTYLCKKFPCLSYVKKEDIFVDPDIGNFMKDKEFETTMTTKEKEAWVEGRQGIFDTGPSQDELHLFANESE
ncbi:hypothetical protein TNCV_882591 [Trichonephila clavipes]|nr:hypothetical protein TNCV_882591 [Trichonephila clavipes]